jgi:hypothetical protein
VTELEGRLRRIRAAVREGREREAQDLGVRALADAAAAEGMVVLAGLAARDLGAAGAGDELAAALRAGEGSVEDRLDGWVAVAEDADARRLWGPADAAWAAACEEGGGRQDLVFGRAGALLRAGRSQDALPLLVLATEGEDSALSLGAWLLLSGLYLAAYQLGPALRAAEQASELARSRLSWLAYSAAEIDRSEVLLRRQDKSGALDGLVAALQVVRERGDPGALLVARVHEVRTQG